MQKVCDYRVDGRSPSPGSENRHRLEQSLDPLQPVRRGLRKHGCDTERTGGTGGQRRGGAARQGGSTTKAAYGGGHGVQRAAKGIKMATETSVEQRSKRQDSVCVWLRVYTFVESAFAENILILCF